MKTTILLSLLVGLVFGLAINQAATDSASAQVYAECQRSRLSVSITEKRCGELQDKYNIEFLCEANNNLESNHCWTEAK